MKVGFTCGSFDLLHAGHVRMLAECREGCEYLLVGLQIDPSVDRPNKNRPVQSLEERLIQLQAVRYVDGVIIYSTEEYLIRVLRHLIAIYGDDLTRFIGADWKGKPYTGHDLPIRVVFNSRDHGWSTSELRERIVRSEREATGRVALA